MAKAAGIGDKANGVVHRCMIWLMARSQMDDSKKPRNGARAHLPRHKDNAVCAHGDIDNAREENKQRQDDPAEERTVQQF
jgi:hypothetical protein